jgi:hypothetical protein
MAEAPAFGYESGRRKEAVREDQPTGGAAKFARALAFRALGFSGAKKPSIGANPIGKATSAEGIALSEFWSAARSGRLCDSTSIGNVGSVLRRLTKLQPLWHTKPRFQGRGLARLKTGSQAAGRTDIAAKRGDQKIADQFARHGLQ